ncbi:hypothetical protein [Parasitella parasitica]|uniref:Uncharacterized protein n=1 Tax=Parasitella parasitica TaxID=35722 RepID=A0A0B7NJS5_9FUNG|nr:hypothetical protein [Parasitella parasitica]
MAEIKAHLFPFSVDKEGAINTKQYFKFEKGSDEQYESIMLGRKLMGRSVVLNDKTQCQVYEKILDRYEDDEDEEMEEADEENASENIPWKKTNKVIHEFILWKKDTAPDAEDARINALGKWIDISEAVSSFLNV